MDSNDLRTLKILEEIESNQATSQRELARKLNISLGLANSFLKRLAHKGYFKITNIPKHRIKYVLTPRGAAEKTRLTYRYIQFSYNFYKDARQKLSRLFQELAASGVKRILFYGAGDLAEIAYFSLQDTTVELAGIVDDLNIGKNFLGDIVTSSSEDLELLSFDKIIITSDDSIDNVMEKILKKGIPRNKIVVLE